MKIRTLFIICLTLCCLFLTPTNVFASSAGTENTGIELTEEEKAFCQRTGEITIGCPVDNCPILFTNEKTGRPDGISIDILNMISEQTGLTFNYQALPSGGITYQFLKNAGIDMVAGVEYNGVNMQSIGIAMTEPYIHSDKVFVCKKGVVFQPDSSMVIAVASGSQTIEEVTVPRGIEASEQ